MTYIKKMTYIKWKDEVESYLLSLPQEERQKIFSYFSEMYADKRDAGKSEAQIIEEFGAPYDVAQRILADTKEQPPVQDGQRTEAANVNGGNYNYNYYNYNYGGAPQYDRQAPQSPPPAPAQEPQPKKKPGAGRIIVSIILTIALVGLTAGLIGSTLALIVEGFISIGATSGALVASQCGGAVGAAIIGWGLIMCGIGILLLAPFGALCKILWRKLTAFYKG